MRAIVAHASITDEMLDELKQWLAISGSRDDALLRDLLAAAVATCEQFSGVFPLPTSVSERRRIAQGRIELASRPVRAVGEVAVVGTNLTRTVLPAEDYDIEAASDGAASIRLKRAAPGSEFDIRIDAGLASTWSELDHALRHGIIRLAAHYYNERDEGPGGQPPAAVAALWRPWRRLRL